MEVQWPETDSVVGVGFKTYPSFRFLILLVPIHTFSSFIIT